MSWYSVLQEMITRLEYFSHATNLSSTGLMFMLGQKMFSWQYT